MAHTTGTADLTPLDLIRAHQATLTYLHSNYPASNYPATPTNPQPLTAHDIADTPYVWLTPETPWGRCLLGMMANAMGKPVTDTNVHQVAAYLRGDR
jgi:hypothetical protein